MHFFRTSIFAAAAALTASAAVQAGDRGRGVTYSVTVTNITKAVQFTPIVAATHTRAIALFELGLPAGSPLTDVAESGDITALAAVLVDSEAVAGTAATEGLLQPGDSVTFEIV